MGVRVLRVAAPAEFAKLFASLRPDRVCRKRDQLHRLQLLSLGLEQQVPLELERCISALLEHWTDQQLNDVIDIFQAHGLI